ncbi:RidA family protein [Aminobacter anthyllidis]|uniref:RidA family protein n=1 Tax=Aminobacter anthyllidis TaxID=1035067 RepID=UPI002458F36C|nr:RidA family protein [Aminobacter anthyllidis]MDH4984220.1 RidA family protein [Aminobacter anthyllidis]
MSAAATERPKPLANYPFLREAGGLLFLSGVSARQKDGTIAGVIRQSGEANYDVAAQLRAIIANITESLQSVGGTLADLVDVTIFVTDMAYYPAMNGEYNKWFGPDGPARTTVGVSQLPHPDMVIELKVVARRPD